MYLIFFAFGFRSRLDQLITAPMSHFTGRDEHRFMPSDDKLKLGVQARKPAGPKHANAECPSELDA